jgi:hypothetical protein
MFEAPITQLPGFSDTVTLPLINNASSLQHPLKYKESPVPVFTSLYSDISSEVYNGCMFETLYNINIVT